MAADGPLTAIVDFGFAEAGSPKTAVPISGAAVSIGARAASGAAMGKTTVHQLRFPAKIVLILMASTPMRPAMDFGRRGDMKAMIYTKESWR